MAALYTTNMLKSDVRSLIGDVDSSVSDADLLLMFTTRYFEWWMKYVEMRVDIAPGTYTPASGSQLLTAYTTRGVAKVHTLTYGSGGPILPIVKLSAATYRLLNAGESEGTPEVAGVDIAERTAGANESVTFRVCLAPKPSGAPTNILLTVTLYPPQPAWDGNSLAVDLLAGKTLMRLTAYDAAVALGRGAETIQNILSPVESNALADFGLDSALRSARKALNASA